MQSYEMLAFGAGTGLAAAVLMTLFETTFWRKLGLEGAVEWQVNQVMVSSLLREKYDPGRRLKEAITMHLIHGTLIGSILGTSLGLLAVPGGYFVPAAVSLSLALWLFVPYLFRGHFETSANVRFSRRGLSISFASHVVYGVSLGALLALILMQ
jgi:hypothetical protein